MDIFIYAADVYCKDCGQRLREKLRGLPDSPADPDNERSYDSDEYPKGPYSDGGGEADSPQHCGAGANCINALILSDGQKVGCFLKNDLTSDGVKYVRESRVAPSEITRLWFSYYSDLYQDLCEHDPEKCGCQYRGMNMWSCGHVDGDFMEL